MSPSISFRRNYAYFNNVYKAYSDIVFNYNTIKLHMVLSSHSYYSNIKSSKPHCNFIDGYKPIGVIQFIDMQTIGIQRFAGSKTIKDAKAKLCQLNIQ